MKDATRNDAAGAVGRRTWREFEMLVGEAFRLDGYRVRAPRGATADSTSLPDGNYAAKVTGVMVRAREQTPPQYLDTVRAVRWEVVLVEAVEPPS